MIEFLIVLTFANIGFFIVSIFQFIDSKELKADLIFAQLMSREYNSRISNLEVRMDHPVILKPVKKKKGKK